MLKNHRTGQHFVQKNIWRDALFYLHSTDFFYRFLVAENPKLREPGPSLSITWIILKDILPVIMRAHFELEFSTPCTCSLALNIKNSSTYIKMSKLDRLCGHKWSQHEINTDKVFCLKMGKNSAIRQFFLKRICNTAATYGPPNSKKFQKILILCSRGSLWSDFFKLHFFGF